MCYACMVTRRDTVDGKILEGEIFGESLYTDEAIGEENFDESAGSLSVIPMCLYILTRKIW